MKKFTRYLLTGWFIVISQWAWAMQNDNQFHYLFDQVLKEHVNDGYVNYQAIRNDQRFFDYVESLKTANINDFESDSAKLAFWINAYNALAIKGILDGKSPSTLWGRKKYFLDAKYQLAGRKMSLNHLEMKVIIPLDEVRIHFAIVCASYSCPKLRSEAYVAEHLERQLEENAHDFVNDSLKNAFDKEKSTARISKIFKWFKKDFVTKAGSLDKYLAQYVKDTDIVKQLNSGNFKVKFQKYNWNLNGVL